MTRKGGRASLLSRLLLANRSARAYIETKQANLKTEGIMADYVSLSRSAFSRGVKDVLSLKPLRDAASSAIYGKTLSPTKMAQTKTRTVTVVRSNDSGWHVKRAN